MYRQNYVPKKRHFRKLWLLLFIVLLVGAYCGWVLHRPIATLVPTVPTAQLQIQAPVNSLAWAPSGQAAVGYVGTDILITHGAQKTVPIASTAKVLSALAVLSKKPLKVGDQGPMLTLDAHDVALYQSYIAQDGSVVPVAVGEQISEYQVLEAMLLPSANNMADSLATWAFGSLTNYSAYANTYAKQLGLKDTHVGSDASGFSPTTTSTASDLVLLGKAAMENPVLAQIVAQTTAGGIPEAGTIKNVNLVLGVDNIVGIKTGNTDQAGGVFIAASQPTVSGHSLTVITAVIGLPTLFQAMHYSLPLMQSAQQNVLTTSLMSAGAIVGNYKLPWGGNIQAVAGARLVTTALGGDKLPATISLKPIRVGASVKQSVGTVTSKPSLLFPAQSVPVYLKQSPTKPSVWWRLLHPQDS